MTEYRTKHTISILELGIEILNSNFYLYRFMYSESELSPRNSTVGDLLEALGPTTRSLTLIHDQN